MLKNMLSASRILLLDEVKDWQQAIKVVAQPLLEAGVITQLYVEEIERQHHELGPFYVLAPGLAMPHARPENGAKALGLALLKLKRGVRFDSEENDPVDLIFMLSAPDADSHIGLISELAELFSCEADMARLHQANSKEDLISVLNNY